MRTRFYFLLTLLSVLCLPCSAYLDTTAKNFPKPKSIEVKAYQYQESQYDKYVDIAATKVAPKVFSSLVTGPTGLILSLGDKAIKLQEKYQENQTEQKQ